MAPIRSGSTITPADKDPVRHQHALSIQDVVKSLKRQTGPFGIEGYTLPSTDIVTNRPRTTKMKGYKVPGFIEKACKLKSFMPPADYDVATDWQK